MSKLLFASLTAKKPPMLMVNCASTWFCIVDSTVQNVLRFIGAVHVMHGYWTNFRLNHIRFGSLTLKNVYLCKHWDVNKIVLKQDRSNLFQTKKCKSFWTFVWIFFLVVQWRLQFLKRHQHHVLLFFFNKCFQTVFKNGNETQMVMAFQKLDSSLNEKKFKKKIQKLLHFFTGQ